MHWGNYLILVILKSIQHCPQWFSRKAVLFHRDTAHCLGAMCDGQPEGSTPGIEWTGPRNAIKQPTKHRTVPYS